MALVCNDTKVKSLLDRTVDIFNPLSEDEVITELLDNNASAIAIYKQFGIEDFDDSWILITTEMKLKYFTQSTGNDIIKYINGKLRNLYENDKDNFKILGKSKLCQLLDNNSEDSLDYPQEKYLNLPPKGQIITDNNNSQYYFVRGIIFKEITMIFDTESGKLFRKYFVLAEQGFRKATKYFTIVYNECNRLRSELYIADLMNQHRLQIEELKENQLKTESQVMGEHYKTEALRAQKEEELRVANIKLERSIEINNRYTPDIQTPGFIYIARTG